MGKKLRASFYGVDPKKEHLNKTFSDGTLFDPNSLAVASWDYPLGTELNLTSPDTGKSVTVTVKDRGPGKKYLSTRQLDMTVGTMNALGLDKDQGIFDIDVEPKTMELLKKKKASYNMLEALMFGNPDYLKYTGLIKPLLGNMWPWESTARTNSNVQRWWEGMPESSTRDIVDFMKRDKTYNYKSAIDRGLFPTYQPEHKQYRWSDIGKL